MEVWKIMFLSTWLISRFHVNLPGCKGHRGWFFSHNSPPRVDKRFFFGLCTGAGRRNAGVRNDLRNNQNRMEEVGVGTLFLQKKCKFVVVVVVVVVVCCLLFVVVVVVVVVVAVAVAVAVAVVVVVVVVVVVAVLVVVVVVIVDSPWTVIRAQWRRRGKILG